MTPPPFSDLGKSAKDLFSKGYAHGTAKLDVTTKSGPTVEFKSAASHNLASQKLDGNLEVKYKVPDHGLTITEKWSVDNKLTTIAELKDKIARGLTVTLDTHYFPQTSKRGALLKTEWSGESVKVNGDLTLFDGPVFSLAVVAQIKGNWLVGGYTKFDLATNELKSTTLSVGRKMFDYTLHSFCVNGREYGGSIYHQVHKNLEYGVQLGWNMGQEGAHHWGIAAKYDVNPELTIRAKLDNKSQLSLASTHNLSDAVKLTLGTHFGLTGFPDSMAKFGIGLEYKQ